jgi:Putative transposase of IS4/5 family (DUF4096)
VDSMTRQQHSRERLRYGSDLTDAEWAIIAPLLPAPRSTGRPRRWPMRELMNAIFYVPRSGCPWRMVPANFAPPSTVYRWFLRLRDDGVLEAINDQPSAPYARPGAGRMGGEPVGGGARQPKCQDDRSWRAAGLMPARR